ncbi:hypothetical protein ACFL0V_03095 [Nanoarchaeota archaeon]
MNKRMSAFLLVAIMVLSLMPMAFAENEDAGQPEPMLLEEGEAVEAEPVLIDEPMERPLPPPKPRLARAELREGVKDRREDFREKRAETVERFKELQKKKLERFKDRPKLPDMKRANAKLQAAKEKYMKAKEHYMDAKKKYQEKRQTFNEAKEDWNKCKKDDSEECVEKKEKVKKHAKEHLLKSADLVLKELDRVKSKVESSEDLSEEEIEELVAKLDEKIQEVEDAKAVIENLGEDATKEEINAAAKTIREAWKATKVHLKRTVGRLANARLGNIIVKTEKLEERFYHARDKLADKGMDVTELDAVLDEFSAELDSAADHYNRAKEIWKDAKSEGEVDGAVKKIRELLAASKENLKNAKDLLRAAVKEIKSLNQGSLDVEETDEEVEVEVEEETETETEEEVEVEVETETEVDEDSEEEVEVETETEVDEDSEESNETEV